jgi:hypothetical protein
VYELWLDAPNTTWRRIDRDGARTCMAAHLLMNGTTRTEDAFPAVDKILAELDSGLVHNALRLNSSDGTRMYVLVQPVQGEGSG